MAKIAETEQLKDSVERLKEEHSTAKELLKLPEESLARLLNRASSKGRWRGVIEGAVIGFITGVASSGLVWYLTSQSPAP